MSDTVYRKGRASVVMDGRWFQVCYDNIALPNKFYSTIESAVDLAEKLIEEPALAQERLEQGRIDAIPLTSALMQGSTQAPGTFRWVVGRWDDKLKGLHVHKMSPVAYTSETGARRAATRAGLTLDHRPAQIDGSAIIGEHPATLNLTVRNPNAGTGPKVVALPDGHLSADQSHYSAWMHMINFIEDVTDCQRRFKVGITNDPLQRARQDPYPGKYDYMFVLARSTSRDRIAAIEAALVAIAIREAKLQRLVDNDPLSTGEALTQASNRDLDGANHYVYVCVKGAPGVAL